ncbi:MAG: RNA methyltransferase [Candidatus Cloacimonadaceae bacterium]|nr:RNA methyltransferase [Candidatus Cloacimonadaceae bacterium]MDP3114621.1 RNA methyltransferase [Candidatus Cloacimonadaceae bacterium]
MKSLDHYHQNKFNRFVPERQRKAVLKLIQALETALSKDDVRSEIKQHLIECIGLMENHDGEEFFPLAEKLRQTNDLHKILRLIHPWLKDEVRDQDFSVVKTDGQIKRSELIFPASRQIIVILDNLRSVFNVGSIFRTAECLAVKELWLCGITPTPDHRAMNKTSRDTCESVNWRQFDTATAAVLSAKADGCRICALETISGATSVYDFEPSLPMALIIGNEALGISDDVLKVCDDYLYLPVQGWKNSLNVGVAFAAMAYHLVCNNQISDKFKGAPQ